jgi:hypothetical protein
VLVVTARTSDGKELFKARRIYMSQCTDSKGPVMVLGPDKKLGIIRDTTFQPLQLKREEFQINLTGHQRKVEVEAAFSYVLRPGNEIMVNRIKREVAVGNLF